MYLYWALVIISFMLSVLGVLFLSMACLIRFGPFLCSSLLKEIFVFSLAGAFC